MGSRVKGYALVPRSSAIGFGVENSAGAVLGLRVRVKVWGLGLG